MRGYWGTVPYLRILSMFIIWCSRQRGNINYITMENNLRWMVIGAIDHVGIRASEIARQNNEIWCIIYIIATTVVRRVSHIHVQ